MGGDTEATFGAGTEGKAIQWLFHLGSHPIQLLYQTLMWMPTSACWQDPDIAVSWEALPMPNKYRSGCLQPSIGLNRVPNEGARESTQGTEGICSPIGGTTIWTNQCPQSSQGLSHQPKNTHGGTYGSRCLCSRGWPSRSSMGGETLVLWRFYAPV